MRNSLSIFIFFVLTGILNAGLTLSDLWDYVDVDVVPSPTNIDFHILTAFQPGDIISTGGATIFTNLVTEVTIGSGSTAINWSNLNTVSGEALHFVDFNIIFPGYIVGPIVLPDEPVLDFDIPIPEVPEPASLLLFGAGCLMFRRQR